MTEKKTTFSFLRNRDWKDVKVETEKLENIISMPTGNIIELNRLIYAGAKLLWDKIGVPQRTCKEIMTTSERTKEGKTHSDMFG